MWQGRCNGLHRPIETTIVANESPLHRQPSEYSPPSCPASSGCRNRAATSLPLGDRFVRPQGARLACWKQRWTAQRLALNGLAAGCCIQGGRNIREPGRLCFYVKRPRPMPGEIPSEGSLCPQGARHRRRNQDDIVTIDEGLYSFPHVIWKVIHQNREYCV